MLRQMHPEVREELPLIEKILCDEVWLESERRHYPVDPQDPEVLRRVCDIVIANSSTMRRIAVNQMQQREERRFSESA